MIKETFKITKENYNLFLCDNGRINPRKSEKYNIDYDKYNWCLSVREFVFCITNNISSQPRYIECNIENVTFSRTRLKYNKFCGSSCSVKNKDTQIKYKSTLYNNYSVSSMFGLDVVREKALSTKLERYGDKHYNNILKQQETVLLKYGNICIFNTEYFKEKTKQTCQEKYGKDYYLASSKAKDKIIRINQEKYSVDCNLKSEEIISKIRNTNISNGRWLSDENRSEFELYRFIVRKLTEKNNLELLENYDKKKWFCFCRRLLLSRP